LNKPVFYILLFITFFGRAQNLVPNPSFEEIVSCPTMEGQIYLAEPWFQPYLCMDGTFVSCSSCDLYNSSHVLNPPYLNVGVPNNVFGYQLARTGEGYAGIGVWVDNGLRERIEVELLDSLINGSTYCVKMYVVNKRPVSNLTSTSNLHALFTESKFIDSPIVFTVPSVKNPDVLILSDTTNWTEISGCYQALGGERFLTIGNFYDNVNSNVANPSGEFAYYFIDDVSVELSNGQNCECPENNDSTLGKQSLFIPNVFTPNNDGQNDKYSSPDIKKHTLVKFMTANRRGQVVFDTNNLSDAWENLFSFL